MSPPLIPRTAQSASAPIRALAERLIEGDGPQARRFENLIMALIAASLVSVGLELIPHLPGWAATALYVAEVVIVIIFSFEYLLRFVAAKSKLAIASRSTRP